MLEKKHNIVFRATKEMYDRFLKKAPSGGDRSIIMRQLLSQYLEDKIKLPPIKRP